MLHKSQKLSDSDGYATLYYNLPMKLLVIIHVLLREEEMTWALVGRVATYTGTHLPYSQANSQPQTDLRVKEEQGGNTELALKKYHSA